MDSQHTAIVMSYFPNLPNAPREADIEFMTPIGDRSPLPVPSTSTVTAPVLRNAALSLAKETATATMAYQWNYGHSLVYTVTKFEFLRVLGTIDCAARLRRVRPRIRHKLPDICFTVGETSEKKQSPKREANQSQTQLRISRQEKRLRVFQNKVLRKIFGAKRDEVTGEWRKLHNTKLHTLYSSPDIIRNIKSRLLRWAGHVARMGESRNAYRVFAGRPEGKRPLGRPRRRWEDNIKMDLREVRYDDRDWINLAQDRGQ
ncbi:hypothetical protein ANN_17578 [Periplaneta americana]|uniref:Uncharacterized protein n=1 Tax=Periplaneta americana TaxID=6978 RepID=A0ABQ8SUC3_PERAM|nr:hypothetical protein ANN_17578 [Periplaneta americana]